jgi:RNA polymerase sigma factor (sigma-70 family)
MININSFEELYSLYGLDDSTRGLTRVGISTFDSGATKPSLLLRIRDADDSASWSEFAEIYGPVIRSYCRRRGLQPTDADDVVQETLLQVARSIGTFDYDSSLGRFRDWLGTVVRNKITRFFESKSRQVATIDNDQSAQLEASSECAEWTASVHARILEVALLRIRAGFESSTWDAFERLWCVGSPAPEVARTLGMAIDSVYAAKSRVLKRLREEILLLAGDWPLALSQN